MNKSSNQQAMDSFTNAGLESARIVLDALQELSNVASANNPLLMLQNQSCCDIPPACWLPQCFGEFSSSACPCGTALLRIQVTNCQPVSNNFRLAVKGDKDVAIKITPDHATLGAMERKWFTVAITIPEDACKGECYDLVVWVDGCKQHYGRWTISVAGGCSGTCLEARLSDCPDYVHHWYDHFYCNRHCPTGKAGRRNTADQ